MKHFCGDKFRKIKANERNNTGRIISEFNEDFTNFAPLKLNGFDSRSAKSGYALGRIVKPRYERIAQKIK